MKPQNLNAATGNGNNRNASRRLKSKGHCELNILILTKVKIVELKAQECQGNRNLFWGHGIN